MLDWVSDPEWNWEDLPKAVDLLWARDGENWEHWEQHYSPVPFVNPVAVVINYLAADMGMPQQVDFQVGGATPTCTLTGLEGKCLLSLSPPAEGKFLLSPSPPAEGKCLLVAPSEPHQSPASEGEPHQSPASEGDPHQSRASEGDPHQSRASEGDPHQSPARDYTLLPPPLPGDYTLLPPPQPGDYTLLPPPLPGDYTLLPPPLPGDYTLLPPPSPGDYTLLPPPPLPPLGAEQQELPLFPLTPPAGAEQQELPLPPPPAEGEYLLVPPPLPWEDCLPLPPTPAEGEYLLVPPPPPWENCLPHPPPPTEGEYLLVPPSLLWEDCLPLPLPPTEELQLSVAPTKDACLASPKDACLSPPKDACLALPKDACLASPKDASLASPGAACCSASPGAVWCSASPGAACCSASPEASCCSALQQEVLWLEPHQGELPALKKVGEVWRPPTPAAFLLPGGQRDEKLAPQSARLLTAWPVAAWLLAILQPMNPLKSLFLARGGAGTMERRFEPMVDVTLDPDTAHVLLILSAEGKRVTRGETRQDLPDNPERFDDWPCVLGTEGFTSGRRYWQVQVGENTGWKLGVCRESADRKGVFSTTPQQGYWTVEWSGYRDEFTALTDPVTPLLWSLKPQKLGVYLEYEEGQLSFYHVETRSHIYTFTDMEFNHNEKLYPFFYTCSDIDLVLESL
ncbi:UNVERIFIED_CONTAM: hypothetical protein FKN15_021821 [Acipenser sinensis]